MPVTTQPRPLHLRTALFVVLIRQRCPNHWPLNSVTDAFPAEWVHLDPVRHGTHILHRRPADLVPAPRHEDPFRLEFSPQRTDCAVRDCRNGTVLPVEEDWVCYSCERKHRRRAATHRKWQAGADATE